MAPDIPKWEPPDDALAKSNGETPDPSLADSVQQSMAENRALLKRALGHQRGIIFRDLALPASDGGPHSAFLAYTEAQVDSLRMAQSLVRRLLEGASTGYVVDELAPAPALLDTLDDAVRFVMRGKVLFQAEGTNKLYALELASPPYRGIEAPETEAGLTGPREAFTELLVVNLSQLRRRLPSYNLRVESVWIGKEAKVEAVLCWMNGLPTDQMVKTVRTRLAKVDVDGVQCVSELLEAMADSPVSLFPSVLLTERPDTVAHYLLGGRVAVMLENGPRAMILPALDLDFFSTSDDFYEWRPFVFFLRTLRFLAFAVAVPLPALYVAVTTYHVQALPTELTLSLLAQREGAPLPAPVEAFVMTLIFEILREAGVRLPRAIGPTVSIVGGLVIGEAAIRSGITSPAMVLVVTATAVATFSLPSPTLANSATYCRFVVLALASAFGFFGLMIGYLAVVANLAGMTSLGVAYAVPLFPLVPKYWRTVFGLKPRPPVNTGAIPSPVMTRQAEDYQERRN